MLDRPHERLREPRLAGWAPKAASEKRCAVLFEPDVPVRLPDGTVLRGDLYRPKASGSFPALVSWSNYAKELQNTGIPLPIHEVGVTATIVSRGYCHLIVNARGTGKSRGERAFLFSHQEQQDVADTIEWVAEQGWCDGNVGMAGMSYFAVIQYLAAAKNPPHLRAIFPYLGLTDLYRHLAHPGGAVQAEFLSNLYAAAGATQKVTLDPRVRHFLGYLLDHPWFERSFNRVFFPLRPLLAKKLRPGPSWVREFVALVFDEPHDGTFYRERSPWPVLDRIRLPVCLGANWGNVGIHLRGAFDAWQRIEAPKKLFIGPPQASWPWETYQDELLAFYDHHLKGLDNGFDELPPVRYWLHHSSYVEVRVRRD